MGLIQSVAALRAKTEVYKEEGVLFQYHNIETLPEFSACWLAQQICCQPHNHGSCEKRDLRSLSLSYVYTYI